MGASQASGPGDRRSALGSPSPGEAARARRAAQAPPSGPSPKCFRTCHPPPAPFSPPDGDAGPAREGRARRAREDGRVELRRAGRGLTAGAHRGPAAPRPLAGPRLAGSYCSRAAPARRAPPAAARSRPHSREGVTAEEKAAAVAVAAAQ